MGTIQAWPQTNGMKDMLKLPETMVCEMEFRMFTILIFHWVCGER